MSNAALAEFQDNGLQSVAGHPQHGSRQSSSGPGRGQLGRQWGVRGGGDPGPAAATGTEKSVLHGHGVHSGGGSRKRSFGFRRPVSLCTSEAENVSETWPVDENVSGGLLPAWVVYLVVTRKERD